jgi:hypothetical protein
VFGQHCHISRWYGSFIGLEWYKNRGKQNRKLTKKLVVEKGHATTKEKQPIAEQLS